jgi:hypothetical protein
MGVQRGPRIPHPETPENRVKNVIDMSKALFDCIITIPISSLVLDLGKRQVTPGICEEGCDLLQQE